MFLISITIYDHNKLLYFFHKQTQNIKIGKIFFCISCKYQPLYSCSDSGMMLATGDAMTGWWWKLLHASYFIYVWTENNLAMTSDLLFNAFEYPLPLRW